MSQIFEPGKAYEFKDVRFVSDHVGSVHDMDERMLRKVLIMNGGKIVGTGGTEDRLDYNGESMMIKRSWCEEVIE